MQKYPIRLTRKSYNGTGAATALAVAEHNKLCTRVEEYGNAQVESWPAEKTVGTIEAFDIARALDVTTDAVSDVLGGENGRTVER